MDGPLIQSYVPQANAGTGNHGPSNNGNVPSLPTQSIMFSFPPPPTLTPSPENPQYFSGDSSVYVMQPANLFQSVSEPVNATSQQQGDVILDGKQPGDTNNLHGLYQSSGSQNGNAAYSNQLKDPAGVTSLNAVELPGIYPVLLTPSSFMHPVCGNGNQALYQQFSPTMQSQLSHLYPFNVMSPKDPMCTSTSMTTMPPICPEYSIPPGSVGTQLLDATMENSGPQMQLMVPAQFCVGKVNTVSCTVTKDELLTPADLSSSSQRRNSSNVNLNTIPMNRGRDTPHREYFQYGSHRRKTDRSEELVLDYPEKQHIMDAIHLSVNQILPSAKGDVHLRSYHEPMKEVCRESDAALINMYLLKTAVNLSMLTNALLKKMCHFCQHCKKHFNVNRHKNHVLLNHRCTRTCVNCTKKISGSLNSGEYADNVSVNNCKEPVPDVFNQWPNIPLPPPPVMGAPCTNACCEDLNCATDIALPLAAALFHGDRADCCGDAVDEDPPAPSMYPIGVFWDIENCAVPSGKSAHAVVQRVRERFFAGHKEAEFMCVCDIIKENRNVIEDLNRAQVDVVHINATAKNAADDKLRQSIRRFAHNHPAPATVVLITGDTNFTSEVSDLRHRHQYFVVLIHPSHASQSLKQAANTVISYEEMVSDLPIVIASSKDTVEASQSFLFVSNLPHNGDANAIRSRLLKLSENCGGKVVKLSMGTAILRFTSVDVANRAMKRINGEDVFGHRIDVTMLKENPLKNSKAAPGTASTPGRNAALHRSKNLNGAHSHMTNPSKFVRSMPFMPAPSPGHMHQTFANFPPMYPPPYPPALRPPFQPIHQVFHPSAGYYAPAPTIQNLHNTPHGVMAPMPRTPHFQPVVTSVEQPTSSGIKLTVSNIDAQLGVKSIRDILLKEISSYCQVLDMKVRPHNRFTVVCDVMVPHLRDASNVLQNLQRQKIGTKRVLVTLAQQNQIGEELSYEESTALKKNCFSILEESMDQAMPLSRFFNNFETRFQQKISIEELRQIQDVIVLEAHPGMQCISLAPKIKNQQSLEQHLSSYSRSGRSSPDGNHAFLLPVCKLHFPADTIKSSKSNKNHLLKIEMGLREFSAKLHALLHSHNGILQLDGFEYCYSAEYGAFPYPSDPNEGGVIVEHQASYVPGVQIITSQPHCLGVKAIVWAQPQSDIGSDSASDTSGASRWKSPNLIYFSREVVELLKERPYCCLPYEKFSSAYQLHFGHSCRPSEFGFTRLTDLLAAIPHVLQIIGSLSDRVVTLTHRAQVKRFTHEVVKILKTTPDRAILVAQMPELFNRTFNRVWRLRDYGVSVLADLLDDIPEGHICTSGEGDNIVLSLPLRERSAEEKERTGQFAREVIKILRNRPHYRMPFTEFVPAYHRQFGRQCKLSNYGFSKLIDLFEALPLYVQVTEKGAEKHIMLTESERKKVLSIQLSTILRAQIRPAMPLNSGVRASGQGLPLACVPALFQQKYRFPLLPEELGCRDLDELMRQLSHAVKVYVNNAGDKMIRLAHRKPLRQLMGQLLTVILDCGSNHLDVDQLSAMYLDRFKETLEPTEYGFMSISDVVRKALPGVIKMDLDAPECVIHVKPLYIEAKAIRTILMKNNGTMTLGEFNFAYLTTFHRPVDCEKLGFPSFEALLRALSNVVSVKGFGSKRTLTLRDQMHSAQLEGMSKEIACSNSFQGSASLDDLQSLDACQPRFDSWMPKVPQCMLPFWKDLKEKKAFHSSASMGNFKTGQSSGDWLAHPQGLTGMTQRNYKNAKSKTMQGDSPSSKMKNHNVAPKAGCSFTVGDDVFTSNACTPVKGETVQSIPSFSRSVITLPNGSTPIASTSSCSTSSSAKSSVDASYDTYSSDIDSSSDSSRTDCTNCYAHQISSLPSSPYDRLKGKARTGSLQLLENRHVSSDGASPQRIQLAASFPTLTHS